MFRVHSVLLLKFLDAKSASVFVTPGTCLAVIHICREMQKFHISNVRYARVGECVPPQGTKLGPILFAVLVNSLLRDWNFRIKFVDDLTTIEFIPRCSLSVTPLLVNDIYDYASTRGMRLNSKKCKEMIINFLQYRLPFQDALQVGGNTIERVSSYKLLGVYLNNDLSWNLHCDYITKKANKRLYILRILRRARVGYQQLVTVYCSLVRPILEYAAPVWSAIPDYLKAKVERVQKRALKIIDPGSS